MGEFFRGWRRKIGTACVLVGVCHSTGLLFAQDELDQTKVIEKIKLLGGKVERDESLSSNPVVSISFEGSERFTDKYIHLLKSFPDLKSLDLSGTTVTDKGFETIPELKSLTELNLYDTRITRLGLSKLQNSSPQLKIIKRSVIPQRIKDLGGTVRFKDGVENGPVVGVVFDKDNEFRDEFMPLFKPLKSLGQLILFNTTITDVGLKELRGMKLTTLSLNGTKITDAGLKELKDMNLRVLGLRGTQITDVGLKEMRDMMTLTVLDLNNTQITDDGLKQLRGLKNLKMLYLQGTLITEVGLNELQESLEETKVFAGVQIIMKFELLGGKIERDDSLPLKPVVGLSFADCKMFTDGDVQLLRAFPELKTLDLSGTQITSVGLEELNGLNKLTYLSLSNTTIRDAGLKELRHLENLATLDLRGTKITDVGIKELQESLKETKIVVDTK
jgi:internalin A